MKKLMLCIFTLSITLTSFSQASNSGHFELTVHFDTDIPIETIAPHYFKTSGNVLNSVSYSINKLENSMTLKGYNSYIVNVNFPLLAFMVTSSNIPEHEIKPIETKTFYYLSSHNVSSYTGEQNKHFFFSKKKEHMVIIASQKINHAENVHQTLELNKVHYYDGDPMNLSITNELVKINRL